MTYYDPYDGEESLVNNYEAAMALVVELHRIVSTMPDPTYEVKCALANVQSFFKKACRRHEL